MNKLVTTSYEPLKTIGGTPWVDHAVVINVNQYSAPINTQHWWGNSQGLVVLAADTPDIDIYYEISLEGRPTDQAAANANGWVTVNDISGNDISDLYTACTTSMYIELDLAPAPWIRFRIEPDASGTVSMWLVQQQ